MRKNLPKQSTSMRAPVRLTTAHAVQRLALGKAAQERIGLNLPA